MRQGTYSVPQVFPVWPSLGLQLGVRKGAPPRSVFLPQEPPASPHHMSLVKWNREGVLPRGCAARRVQRVGIRAQVATMSTLTACFRDRPHPLLSMTRASQAWVRTAPGSIHWQVLWASQEEQGGGDGQLS